MNWESLIDALTCQLDISNKLNYHKEKHLVNNPMILPCCSRIACNDCIIHVLSNGKKCSNPPNHYYYECFLCNKQSKIGISSDNECMLERNQDASRALDGNLIELNHYMLKKLDGSIKNLNDRFEFREANLNKRKLYIENEIHEQVEAIKKHLDNLEIEMKESLSLSTKNMEANLDKYHYIVKDELANIKQSFDGLKSNAFSYAYQFDKHGNEKNNQNENSAKGNGIKTIDLSLQHQSVNLALNYLNDVNKMSLNLSIMIDELRFDPNFDLPNKSFIGRLKKIKEINFREQFKSLSSQSQINRINSSFNSRSNQLVPITPKFLCIPDQHRLLFTDSQSKQIIELRLDSGDFVSTTNLGGQIKNPDGICSDKSGFIYVTDAEQSSVFKLDSNLNFVKKFGQKELKWPRGIICDSDFPYFSSGKVNSNRIYVCDFSNQCISIYNEHEQFRGYIQISNVDEAESRINKKQHTVEEENRFCPLNVAIAKSFVYVCDDWTGGNCVRMFDKETHALLKNIGHLNAWNPLGLILDDNGYLFTIARLYYETGNTYLFCFDKDGELLYKTNLNINSESILDIAVDNFTERASSKRIICTGDKKIHFLKF